jgi:dihydropyrimidinase
VFDLIIRSDADLVVWDSERVREVQGEQMHSRSGYSIYDGMVVTGWPRYTLRRGQVVLGEDGAIRATPGSGRLVPRKTALSSLDESNRAARRAWPDAD